LGVNIRHDMVMARQTLAAGASSSPLKAFKAALKDALKAGAAGDASSGAAGGVAPADQQKLKDKLNEAMAVSFIAPLLADALGKSEQTYFANSPAEQAYARQLYTEIATRIGQSSKFPVARDIAKAMLQRLNDMQQADTQAAGAPSTDAQAKVSS
jgi:hypothetical protein